MALQNFWNQNLNLNHMNRGGYYQQQKKQGNGKYNQYDDNSSVGIISGRQVYMMNKLPPIPRGPALAPPINENRSGHSDYVYCYQCSTRITSSHQSGDSFVSRLLGHNHMWISFLLLCMVEIFQNKRHTIHIKMFKTVRLVCGVNIGT